MTPSGRVDALTDEQCREILIRIVEAVDANPAPWSIASILNDWSLLDTMSEEELEESLGNGD